MNGDFSRGKNITGEIHRQAYISSICVRSAKSSALEFWSHTWGHTSLESGAQASADEFGLHFFVLPREFLFLQWSAAVSLHSSEHVLSQ